MNHRTLADGSKLTLMKFTLALLALAFTLTLSSCTSIDSGQRLSLDMSALEKGVPLGTQQLRLNQSTGPFLYELRNTYTGNILATAESAITSDDISPNREFRGEIEITHNRDHSKIVVREDVSDAVPSARFISFTKDQSGQYQTHYLSFPAEHWTKVAIAYEFPVITGFKSNEKIMVHYERSKVNKTLPTKALSQPETLH